MTIYFHCNRLADQVDSSEGIHWRWMSNGGRFAYSLSDSIESFYNSNWFQNVSFVHVSRKLFTKNARVAANDIYVSTRYENRTILSILSLSLRSTCAHSLCYPFPLHMCALLRFFASAPSTVSVPQYDIFVYVLCALSMWLSWRRRKRMEPIQNCKRFKKRKKKPKRRNKKTRKEFDTGPKKSIDLRRAK